MNNGIDKLKAEMQSAVENIYSQIDINTHGLESATADFESHREAYLAGQQYEADIHRDMRDNYARLQDRYNCKVQELSAAKSYLSELINIIDSFGLADIQQCGRKDYACMNCKYFSNNLNHALCEDSEFFQWKHYQDAKALLAKYK